MNREYKKTLALFVVTILVLILTGCDAGNALQSIGVVKEKEVSQPAATPTAKPTAPAEQATPAADKATTEPTATAPASAVAAAPADFPKVPVNATGTIDLGDCGKCHSNLEKFRTKDVALKARLIFNHPVHFKKGFTNCSVCHKDPVHGKDSIGRIPMRPCYQCHGMTKTAKATGKCAACHPADFNLKPGDHKGKWRPVHGKLSIKDKGYCDMCHLGNFCVNCHKLPEMPHPEAFKASHKKYTGNRKICYNCHPGADFCTKCHHKQYVPGGGAWKTVQHPKNVLKTGAQPCFTCHDPRYCAHCHTRINK